MTDTALSSSAVAAILMAALATAGPNLLATLPMMWALLFGMGSAMIANGLQGPLFGLCAGLEDFSTTLTGLIINSSLIVPNLVARVGRLRVFAALASLVSIAAILPPVIVNPWAWCLLRFLIGLGYAGLTIVAESRLNDPTPNARRGHLLSVYMIVSLDCMAGGPLLLNLADPSGFELFILASVLVSAALIPLLLMARPPPRVETPSKMSLLALYCSSPLAVIGGIGNGLVNGTFIGLTVVLAQRLGYSAADSALFLTFEVVGAGAPQWPLGYLSDRFDCRTVLAVVFLWPPP